MQAAERKHVGHACSGKLLTRFGIDGATLAEQQGHHQALGLG